MKSLSSHFLSALTSLILVHGVAYFFLGVRPYIVTVVISYVGAVMLLAILEKRRAQ